VNNPTSENIILALSSIAEVSILLGISVENSSKEISNSWTRSPLGASCYPTKHCQYVSPFEIPRFL